jgi:hypothetical protein
VPQQPQKQRNPETGKGGTGEVSSDQVIKGLGTGLQIIQMLKNR